MKTSPIHFRLTGVAFFLALLVSPSGEQAQSQPAQSPGVIRANTRLVVVDVVATDSNGNPVADLTEKDFTVLESGRPQRIGSFSFQSPSTTVEQPAQLPPNVISNVPRRATTSLNVILLDRINGVASSHIYAQDRIVKYLESGAAIQPTAVFVLDRKLSMVHDFTSDNKALKDALNAVRPGGVSRLSTVDIAASPYATKGDFHTDERSVEFTLNALRQLTRTLKGYPGRKNLLWVSEAFPINLTIEGIPQDASPNAAIIARSPATGPALVNNAAPAPGADPGVGAGAATPPNNAASITDTLAGGAPDRLSSGSAHDFATEIARLADALMDAHIALYPIDAGGMGSANRIAAQSNMRDMADHTGGVAFYNRNDVEAGVAKGISDGSTYYALSYYPDNRTWDGRFRKIEVKAARAGVNLHYRTGYYALDPAAAARREAAELGDAFAYAMTYDAPPFAALRFQASVIPPAAGSRRVTVNFAVDPHTVLFERQDDGLEHGSVSCAVAAFSEKGDAVKGFTVDVATVPAKLNGDQFQKLQKAYYPCKREFELKPGKYVLRLGAADRNGHAIGTLLTNVTVN
jgi:VWFA-related protein